MDASVDLQRPIVQLEQVPFAPLRVGDIYQRFSGPAEGRVENIIKFSIPFLLEQGQLPGPDITWMARPALVRLPWLRNLLCHSPSNEQWHSLRLTASAGCRATGQISQSSEDIGAIKESWSFVEGALAT